MVSETSCDEILSDIADELLKLKRETQFISVRIEELRNNIRTTMFLKNRDEEENNVADDIEEIGEDDGSD